MKLKSTYQSTYQKKGFTLIELLIVIAIIGILSSVVLASLGSTREKAGIAKLKGEIGQFVNAMELYHADFGSYPPNFYVIINSNGIPTSIQPSYDALKASLSPYLSDIPKPTSIPNGSVRYFKPPSGRCQGATETPSYNIIVANIEGFEDWPMREFYNGTTWTGIPSERCFQWK